MFVIKIKVKGHIKNLTEKTKEIIDTKGIKKDNTISYIHCDIKNKITIEENQVIMIRENQEFAHKIIFELSKEKTSEYYLKELNNSIEFNILTTALSINNNKIDITYKIIESECIYNYVLEVSDET